MRLIKKLINYIKYQFRNKEEFYGDSTNKDFMANKYIPEAVFEENYILYSVHYNKDKDHYKVLARKYNQEKLC